MTAESNLYGRSLNGGRRIGHLRLNKWSVKHGDENSNDLETHNVGRLEPLVNNRDTRRENRHGVMYEPGPSAGTRFRMEMPHKVS